MWFEYIRLYFWGAFHYDNKHVSITICFCIFSVYVTLSLPYLSISEFLYSCLEWLRAIGDTELLEIPLGRFSGYYVCIDHFSPNDLYPSGKRKPNAVPIGRNVPLTPDQLKCWVSHLPDEGVDPVEHEDEQLLANPQQDLLAEVLQDLDLDSFQSDSDVDGLICDVSAQSPFHVGDDEADELLDEFNLLQGDELT